MMGVPKWGHKDLGQAEARWRGRKRKIITLSMCDAIYGTVT